MFLYNLRLSWNSLLRNPVMSLMTIGAIGLGIAVASSFTTIYHMMSADPLPEKSDLIHYVRLDAWNPDRAWDDDHPERPPNQLTHRDAVAVMESDIPTHATAAYRASLFVYPSRPGEGQTQQRPGGGQAKQDGTEQPFEADVRLCHRGFFPIFEVPFAHGGPWDQRADAGPEPVVVIDDATNQRLFGGENSVGRKIRIAQRHFTVAGVLAPWRPMLKLYDVHNDATSAPEAIYMPFAHTRDLAVRSSGNTSNWKRYDRDDFASFLASEATWIQMWAQLETPDQVARYQTFLDGYAEAQRAAGRFQRPNNNWIQPMREWHDEEGVVPPESKALVIIALLFLTVCSINLIGLLLGKYLARAPEVGVRRALGASRWAIFTQHIVECQLLGVLGGALGLVLSLAALSGINRMLENQMAFQLDLTMVAVGLGLALISGLIAGVYPAWRICAAPPAIHLKTQ